MISLAVDAMGGDFAPRNIVEGVGLALDAAPGLCNIILVGDRRQMADQLVRLGKSGHPNIELVHAEQVVEMNEAPAAAVRGKPKSSIAIAVDLVKQGAAQAVFSAGHTGAAVASAVLKMRPLPGVERPAIATVFPNRKGRFLLLDAGASVDCRSQHLAQFAAMGEVYSRHILGIANPRIGLLNIGEEPSKGNEMVKEAHELLTRLGRQSLNFVGNVEGSNMFDDLCDVLVCDGFVGNIALKCSEGTSRLVSDLLRHFLKRTTIRKLGALLSRNAYRDIKDVADHSEYGGAPLLGVNGVCIIGHGSSCPNAVANAIRVGRESVEREISQHIQDRMVELNLCQSRKPTKDERAREERQPV